MKYKTVIGLEVHAALNSESKLFSYTDNTFTESANEKVLEYDVAFPGVLPNLNKSPVEKAIKMALALKCKVPDVLMFDRKNYFYPDLAKGYQITQNLKPVGVDGQVEIEVDGDFKFIDISDIHIEEDTASLEHFDSYSLIDYNRSASPLIEIVTTPCIHSAEEAVSFLENLRNILKYLNVSEADTKKGHIRCDVNISIQNATSGEFLTKKVEIKNINSFSNVYNAIKYEEKRQIKSLQEGKFDELIQETRRYDEDTNQTVSMRKKVEGVDYKYFVDTNIPPFKIKSELIDALEKNMPILPNERKKTYINKYNLNLKGASALSKDKDISDYFEECIYSGINPITASNWVLIQILGYLNKHNIEISSFFLTPEKLKTIIDALEKGKISIKQAKEVFFKSLEDKKHPKEFLTSDFKQLTNESEIEKFVDEVLKTFPSQVDEYKRGKSNLFDFFVGQVMKISKGKANPEITKDLLIKKLK